MLQRVEMDATVTLFDQMSEDVSPQLGMEKVNIRSASMRA